MCHIGLWLLNILNSCSAVFQRQHWIHWSMTLMYVLPRRHTRHTAV